MSDDMDLRRRRCLFRATHRGTKEMDWLLGRHAQARLPAADAGDLALWERLVQVPDPQLYDWIVNGAAVADERFAAVVAAIRGANGIAIKAS